MYQGAPTHKFPKLLNEVFMDIRLGKVLIYSTVRTSYPKGYVTFWSTLTHGHLTNIRSLDYLKNLYFHYHKTYAQ